MILRRIIDRITRRMRNAERVGRTIVLRFRFDDFSRATRSHTLPQVTSATAPIQNTALTLLAAAWPMIEERGLTLIGASVANLENESSVQLTLPFDRAESTELDEAIDAVRDRFGGASLTRADRIGSDPGFGVPLLAD